ncbi:MAG TPA: ammonia-forming cytochrome c nitrite reductase subunit c552 [Deltaproteobacteria bacterium]|nr:ammonia-forming cytochrome c nitrite reductase subunit c552 [Deltaproteobacteria bacterium]
MNRNTKIVLAVAVLAAFLFAAIMAQAFFLRPETTIKLARIPAGEHDPAVWGQHYTLQYASYLKNRGMALSPTGFGGSEKVQKSVKEPEILMNFKGMPFSKDYAEDRGHPYALEDLKETRRVTPASVGACMTCKTADPTSTGTRGGNMRNCPWPTSSLA